MNLFKQASKRKRQGHALPFFEREAGYFLSILSILSAFFLASPFFFFSPFFLSIFFSIFLSSFIGAPVCDAAKADALTAANIAATITVSSLLISFSCSVRTRADAILALPGVTNARPGSRLTAPDPLGGVAAAGHCIEKR